MECTLIIKRKCIEYDKRSLEVESISLDTECILGNACSAQLKISEASNIIIFYGFDDLFDAGDTTTSFKIVESDFINVEGYNHIGDLLTTSYIESVELNGHKIFDISECPSLMRKVKHSLLKKDNEVTTGLDELKELVMKYFTNDAKFVNAEFICNEENKLFLDKTLDFQDELSEELTEIAHEVAQCAVGVLLNEAEKKAIFQSVKKTNK